jgi:hypothetical protein
MGLGPLFVYRFVIQCLDGLVLAATKSSSLLVKVR